MPDQQPTREQVVEALKPFAESGNPDHLDRSNPEIAQIFDLAENWYDNAIDQLDAKDFDEKLLELDFLFETIGVDAGFTDPLYLSELVNVVLDEHLMQANQEKWETLAKAIEQKIEEISRLIPGDHI